MVEVVLSLNELSPGSPRWALIGALKELARQDVVEHLVWERNDDGVEVAVRIGARVMPAIDDVLQPVISRLMAREDELITFAMVALDVALSMDARWATFVREHVDDVHGCNEVARRYHRGFVDDVDAIPATWTRCVECDKAVTDPVGVFDDLDDHERRMLERIADDAKRAHHDYAPCIMRTCVRVGRERGKSI